MQTLSSCLLAGLRNDHKVVMKLMEERLHVIHADTRLRRESGLGEEEGEEVEEKLLPPTFAQVSQVSDGSPSSLAVRAMAISH